MIAATCLAAVAAVSAEVEAPRTVTVVPGSRYQAGSLHRLLLGDHWRQVWDTPVEAPVLDPDTRRGLIGGFTQDMTSAYLPCGALVVAPLLEAAGVFHATPELVVMPDDPRLGEYRRTFAGMLGLMVRASSPDSDCDGRHFTLRAVRTAFIKDSSLKGLSR